MLTQGTFFFIWPFFFRRPAGSGHIGLRFLSSSSSFYLNQATWPINTNKRHTDRQIDSISKRKNKSNTRCTIKHSKPHKNADGHTHRSNFTISLLWLLQTHSCLQIVTGQNGRTGLATARPWSPAVLPCQLLAHFIFA